MFTGLVEGLATVQAIEPIASGRRLRLQLGAVTRQLALGESVAINGCCLTVVERNETSADFEAGPETLLRTNLGALVPGSRVNFERALAAGGRLGGHLVQGHIDGTATITSDRVEGDWRIVGFDCGDLASLMVPKGSVAVDGVSLTVVDVTERGFTVMLIPHTQDVTTLGTRAKGDVVNIETDILGKYVMKLLAQMLSGGSRITIEKLRQAGVME